MTEPFYAQSKSVEWHTPARIVDVAREVLGGFDLDPASCAEANETIKATRYYTREDDGLTKPWAGRVWLNPPYGRGETPRWVLKLAQSAERGDAVGFALVPAATEAKWFQNLVWLRAAQAVVFIKGRVAFSGPGGVVGNSNTKGSALVYYGPRLTGGQELILRSLGSVVTDWL